MAHEHGHDRQLARHRAASLAGQEPRRLVAAGDPRLQVGPRTSRPARGMPSLLSPKGWLSPHSARRVPRLFAPLP